MGSIEHALFTLNHSIACRFLLFQLIWIPMGFLFVFSRSFSYTFPLISDATRTRCCYVGEAKRVSLNTTTHDTPARNSWSVFPEESTAKTAASEVACKICWEILAPYHLLNKISTHNQQQENGNSTFTVLVLADVFLCNRICYFVAKLQ